MGVCAGAPVHPLSVSVGVAVLVVAVVMVGVEVMVVEVVVGLIALVVVVGYGGCAGDGGVRDAIGGVGVCLWLWLRCHRRPCCWVCLWW